MRRVVDEVDEGRQHGGGRLAASPEGEREGAAARLRARSHRGPSIPAGPSPFPCVPHSWEAAPTKEAKERQRPVQGAHQSQRPEAVLQRGRQPQARQRSAVSDCCIRARPQAGVMQLLGPLPLPRGLHLRVRTQVARKPDDEEGRPGSATPTSVVAPRRHAGRRTLSCGDRWCRRSGGQASSTEASSPLSHRGITSATYARHAANTASSPGLGAPQGSQGGAPAACASAAEAGVRAGPAASHSSQAAS